MPSSMPRCTMPPAAQYTHRVRGQPSQLEEHHSCVHDMRVPTLPVMMSLRNCVQAAKPSRSAAATPVTAAATGNDAGAAASSSLSLSAGRAGASSSSLSLSAGRRGVSSSSLSLSAGRRGVSSSSLPSPAERCCPPAPPAWPRGASTASKALPATTCVTHATPLVTQQRRAGTRTAQVQLCQPLACGQTGCQMGADLRGRNVAAASTCEMQCVPRCERGKTASCNRFAKRSQDQSIAPGSRSVCTATPRLLSSSHTARSRSSMGGAAGDSSRSSVQGPPAAGVCMLRREHSLDTPDGWHDVQRLSHTWPGGRERVLSHKPMVDGVR